MATSERLALLVTLNATQAIQGFSKIGSTASAELNRAEKGMSRLAGSAKFVGGRMVAASAVAGAGLFKLAQAASNVAEAQNKANVVFEDSVGAVDEFAKTAARSAGLSQRAALDAASQFGQLGKAAGLTGSAVADFSTDMAQLAGDLASFNNTTVDEAIMAIGSGLRGEAEPLRRFGVLLDDATLKAKALELGIYDGTGALTTQQKVLSAQAAILEQTTDAQGDFVRTSDGLANQQRILAAEFENAAAALGEGFLPIAQKIVGTVGDLAGAFNALPAPAKNATGEVLAMGTVALGAAGALSYIVGSAIQLKGKLSDAATAANRLAGTRGLGALAGTAGLVVAGLTVVDSVAKDLLQTEKRLTDATEDLANATGTTLVDAALEYQRVAGTQNDLWAGMAEGVQGIARDLLSLGGTLGQSGDEWLAAREDAAAFNKALEQGPAFLRLYIDGLKAAGVNVDEYESKYQAIIRASAGLEGAQKKVAADVDRTSEAMKNAASSAQAFGGEWPKAVEGVEEPGKAAETAAGQFKSLAEKMDAVIQGLSGLGAAGRDAAAANLAYKDANDDVLKSLGDRVAAEQAAKDAVDEHKAGSVEAVEAYVNLIDAGRGVEKALIDQADAAVAAVAQQVELGASAEGATWLMAKLRAEFVANATKALGNADAAEKLADQYGLIPKDVKTNFATPGASSAAWAAEVVKLAVDRVPGNKETVFSVKVGDSLYWLDILQSRINRINNAVTRNIDPGFITKQPRALGGPVSKGEAYVVGERGPELFVPGKDGTVVPNNWLTNPEVAGMGSSTVAPINVTVNMGLVTDPQATARAIEDLMRRYSSRTGRPTLVAA